MKVSVNLDEPLPQKLVGRAGFNLEFLPSIYMGKAYLVDGTKAGIFPRTPDDPMIKVLPLPDEPKKAYYLEDWDKAKGYTQPLPSAEGSHSFHYTYCTYPPVDFGAGCHVENGQRSE